MKKYKPKKWFSYTRFFLTFVIILVLGRATNEFTNVIRTENNNNNKMLSQNIILDNKENIFLEENIAMKDYFSVPEKGFVVTAGNKKYELSTKDYNLLVAVVACESNVYMDDALAVMSVILNRSDKSNLSPADIVKRPGQFSTYIKGLYYRYLNPDGSLKPSTVKVQKVVNDALGGIRNNNYYSFRSWNSDSYSDNYIVERGNRFK